MPEIPDIYADGVGLQLGPFGCSLNFSISPAMPSPGSAPGQPAATIRMSLEHLKLMAFLLHRQLREYERGTGVKVDVPRDVLNQLRVGREDWEEFWRSDP